MCVCVSCRNLHRAKLQSCPRQILSRNPEHTPHSGISITRTHIRSHSAYDRMLVIGIHRRARARARGRERHCVYPLALALDMAGTCSRVYARRRCTWQGTLTAPELTHWCCCCCGGGGVGDEERSIIPTLTYLYSQAARTGPAGL